MASRKNKHASKTPWLVGAVVIAVLAVIAWAVFAPEKSYDYNSFHVERGKCTGTEIDCWLVDFAIREQPYTISFYNHPQDVENITVTVNALKAVLEMQKMANSTVYIAIPENAPGQVGVAGVALARVLGTRYGIFNMNVKGAVLGTEITCADAGPRVLVITFVDSQTTMVTVPKPNCVEIQATNAAMTVAASEALTYRLFGVIPTYVRPGAQNATNSTA